jgi:dTDP-4-amino-4,6-dideoxygalactose transaminase
MNVEFSGFSYLPIDLKEIWKKQVERVIDSGLYIGGAEVKCFEEQWSKLCGSSYAIGVSNGFDGLVLALRSLGIGAGTRVAVPAHTFIATWNSIIAVGAVPVGVDVDKDGLIDLDCLGDMAQELDAVIPVHMHGSVVDMPKLYELCTSQSLSTPIRIVEDASQSHGALNPDGSKLGKYSDLVVYSLYPSKNLGALGDAGVITTNSEEIEGKLRSLSNYGSTLQDKYSHQILGYNNRLDPIQASVLRINAEMLSQWNFRRKELAELYIGELSEIIEILQVSHSDSVRHHLCMLTPDRDALKQYLLENGVKTEIHYPKVAGIEALSFLNQKSSFPNSEYIAKCTLSLPLSPWHNSEQVDYVIDQIKNWAKR